MFLRPEPTSGGPAVPKGRPGRASDKKPRHAVAITNRSRSRSAGTTGAPMRTPGQSGMVRQPRIPMLRTLYFALRWKATHAVHHWRSTVLFAYSWQVQSRFGFEGSTHVVE